MILQRLKTIPRKYIWVAAGAAAVLLIVGQSINAKNKPNFKTAYTVADQDVKQTVLATGTVTSRSNLNLGFKNSGTVTRVNVSVGDKVRIGQVLAMLDQKDASAQISQARAAVLAAQANYNKVINGASSAEVEISKAAVTSAEVALNNAKTSYELTIKQQEVAVSNAYNAMLNSGLSATAGTGNGSTATVTLSGTYTGEIGQYIVTIGASTGGLTYSVSGIEATYGYVQRGIPQALGMKGLYINFSTTGNLNQGDYWTIAIPNTQSSTYITYYNAYQAALQTQSQTVSAAKGAVDSAQAALDSAKAQLNYKISAARPEDVQAARAQLETAQAQLQTANNIYTNNQIISPIDGTITFVDIKIGETVAPQKQAIVLLDEGNLYVESNISESSIALIKAGQPVDMTLDAFGPDRHLNGQVLSIDPASTVVSGVINFRVISSLPKDENIKPGMTVNLIILINEKPGVLAVPNRLIKTKNGKFVVAVKKAKNKQEDVEINTGLAGDSFTEVTTGLNTGDVLVEPLK